MIIVDEWIVYHDFLLLIHVEEFFEEPTVVFSRESIYMRVSYTESAFRRNTLDKLSLKALPSKRSIFHKTNQNGIRTSFVSQKSHLCSSSHVKWAQNVLFKSW